MSGADALAEAIKHAVTRPAPFASAIGVVAVMVPASPGTPAAALVTGIIAEPISVPSPSWGSPFTASVAAGPVENRRVLVVFTAGQPVIVCLIGA